MSDEQWKLFYWPGIKGRGEYVRLVFEEAGIEYEEKGKELGFAGIAHFVWQGGNTGFPARAPPLVQQGDFVLSGTPVICAFLGKEFGLMPSDKHDEAHVVQILNIVTDGVAEGRLAFHPKNFYASHKEQVEESKPYVIQYGETRLPKYMAYFEDLLKRSTSGFLVGNSVTPADLSVYQYLAAAEHHYKQWYDSVDAPLCKAFQARISQRPRIKAYLESDRCQPFDTDSMM